ncbi:hypothetical protein BMF89_07455 [Arthrobacter sp. SRS-W-1-2016]|uniref:hypothetical protein n=1 Tax=Arthrobacter sp. SRS-W-1-2016 TaxID=1930254 RepID=UPI000991195C|nr:hypothetical protein [Arthrobacter sp. SRS-W-1-2016]OOP63116.1 hypothetical protein BMF89_07455 [Arthrobacter sp. SRS-W-1-2016]
MCEELNEELATRMCAAYYKGQEDRVTVGLAQRDHLADRKTDHLAEAAWARAQVQAGDDFSVILHRLNDRSYALPEAAHTDLESAAYILGRWEGMDSHVDMLKHDYDYAIGYYEMRNPEIGGSLVRLGLVKERMAEEPVHLEDTVGYQRATLAGIDFQREQLRRLAVRPPLTPEAQAAVALGRSDQPNRSPLAAASGQGAAANAQFRFAQRRTAEHGTGR